MHPIRPVQGQGAALQAFGLKMNKVVSDKKVRTINPSNLQFIALIHNKIEQTWTY